MHRMQPAYQAASSTDDNISMFRGTLKSDGLQPFVTSYFVYACDCQSQARQWCFCNSTFLNKHCLYLDVFIWQSRCLLIGYTVMWTYLSKHGSLTFQLLLLIQFQQYPLEGFCWAFDRRLLWIWFVILLYIAQGYPTLLLFVPPHFPLVLLLVSHHCEKLNGIIE